jgi:MFS transporter, DHA2 family, multidrug resistance protein
MNATVSGSALISADRIAVARQPPAPKRSNQRNAIAFAILCLGCFLAFLDIQIVSASVEEVGGGLSASVDDMSWVQTSYLIGDIIVIPLAGWMSRVLSTRWLITVAGGGFTLTSMLCGMAWDIHSMIVFRVLQGVFGGVMIPTAFTASVVLFEGKQKAVAASCVSAAAGLAPTLGPVIGGWITDNYSWHWLFYINFVPGMVVTLLAPIFVRMDEPNLTLLKGADYFGMVLLALSLGCLDYVLEEGTRWEWFADGTVRTCAWIAALAGIGFVIRSLTYVRPIVDLRAFSSRNFCLGCWFSFVTGVGIFGLVYLTPLFLGHVRGFIAWQIGGAILWAGPFQLAAVPIYGFLASRVDLRLLLMIGLICFGVSMWLFTPIMNQWGWEEMLLPFMVRGIAVPFAIASTVTLTMGEMSPERVKSASGLFNLMRNLGGAIGIAVSATVINDRTNLHFLRISEHLNFSNIEVVSWLNRMTSHYTETWGDPVAGQTAALKKLWELAYREAQVQAFADAYLVIAGCFLVSAMMVPLMRSVAKKEKR